MNLRGLNVHEFENILVEIIRSPIEMALSFVSVSNTSNIRLYAY